jgi:bifunctional polynucleotide phosphatase/kinase
MRWLYRQVTTHPGNNDRNGSKIGYVYGTSNNYEEQNHGQEHKIASFDLDQTLIGTMSGKKFSKNSTDWKWMFPIVKQKLYSFHKKGYDIIIATNQAGIGSSVAKLNEFKNKMQNIETDILTSYPGMKFRIYCMIHKDIHRKPYPTIFENMQIDRNVSFYCGDGAGRKNDHTSTDIKFAYNLRLIFRTPENLFLGNRMSRGILNYAINPYSKDVLDAKPYEYTVNHDMKPELILMVGLPGSGKSHIARTIIDQYCVSRNNIVSVSLDQLKTKNKMFKLIKAQANKNVSILVDNTNLEPETRAEIIDIVKTINKKYYVRAIHVNTSMERCLHNDYYRYYVNYRTDPKLVPEFVYKIMRKKFVKPSLDEKIDLVQTVVPGVPMDIAYFYYYY